MDKRKGYLNVDQLEFFRIKDRLKDYLKSQDQFQDYDFEASNFNIILEIMAYNTYLNNFYNNQVGSEAFLDTARIKTSVVSHAKELNYVPRSRASSEGIVNITVNAPTSSSFVTIPRFYRFTTTVDNTTLSFSTNEAIVIRQSEGEFRANNVSIYEGEIVTEFFEVKDEDEVSFPLRSENIDTNSIKVTVINSSNDSANTVYERATSLFGLDSDSNIYFVEGHRANQYKIQFSASGIFGSRLNIGNIVKVEYRDTIGVDGNGAFSFEPTGTVNGHTVSVSTRSASRFGAERESIEDIRFNAPRFFTTQERAVTAQDFINLTKTQFPELQAVTAYGGEEANPPEYGKVIVSVKPFGIDGFIPVRLKDQIENYLKLKSLTTEPIVLDADFFYVEVCSKVYYDPSLLTTTPRQIVTDIIDRIIELNNTQLNDFGNSLRYSGLTTLIDDSDESIISNDTTIRIAKRWSPRRGRENEFTFTFGNTIRSLAVPSSQVQPLGHPPMLDSSPFIFRDEFGTLRTCRLQDNGRGTIFIYYRTTDNQMIVAKRNAGTIDYKTGRVSLKFDVVDYTGNFVTIFGRTRRNDLIVSENRFLVVDPRDVEINMIPGRT